MPLPVSVIIVVTKGHFVLFFKDEKNEWTLPGGHPSEEEESIKAFAAELLYPLFTELSIKSVHLLMPTIEGMSFKDERVRVAVFECKIKGEMKANVKDRIWLADIKNLPSHAISPDIRGVVEMLAALDHFPKN